MKKKRKHRKGQKAASQPNHRKKRFWSAIVGGLTNFKVQVGGPICAAFLTTSGYIAAATIPQVSKLLEGKSSQSSIEQVIRDKDTRRAEINAKLEGYMNEANRLESIIQSKEMPEADKQKLLAVIASYKEANRRAQSSLESHHPEVISGLRMNDVVSVVGHGWDINKELSDEAAKRIKMQLIGYGQGVHLDDPMLYAATAMPYEV